MIFTEELEKMKRNLTIGREWINKKGGFGGGTTPPFDYRKDSPVTDLQKGIVHWFELSDQYIAEVAIRNPQKIEKHTKAWNLMKRDQAIQKWKSTLKSKRGED